MALDNGTGVPVHDPSAKVVSSTFNNSDFVLMVTHDIFKHLNQFLSMFIIFIQHELQ